MAQESPGLHSTPGDSPFLPEHCQVMSWSFRLFAPPIYRVLMEFKPSAFSYLPFLFSPLCTLSFLSRSFQVCGGDAFHTLPPSLSSLHKQKQLPALHSFSLPQITSPCHVPAEFCGSDCADFCVNPQISFLGVQDGLVLIWLYFRDERGKKT